MQKLQVVSEVGKGLLHKFASSNFLVYLEPRPTLLSDFYLDASQTFSKCLMFMFNLAWRARYRLPLLITVSFMILDVRMQLEIQVNRANMENDGDSDSEDEDDEQLYNEDDENDYETVDEEEVEASV